MSLWRSHSDGGIFLLVEFIVGRPIVESRYSVTLANKRDVKWFLSSAFCSDYVVYVLWNHTESFRSQSRRRRQGRRQCDLSCLNSNSLREQRLYVLLTPEDLLVSVGMKVPGRWTYKGPCDSDETFSDTMTCGRFCWLTY